LLAIVARRVGSSGSDPGSGEALTILNAQQLASTQSITSEQARPLLRSAVGFFTRVRAAELRKRPSTAELIDWMRYLIKSGARATQELKEMPDLVHQSLGVLVKSVEDLETVQKIAALDFPLPKG
jgi:hypothetical protein